LSGSASSSGGASHRGLKGLSRSRPDVTSAWSPTPKARCPHCARPVALLRGTHCVYCRKALGKFEGGQKEPSGEAALAIAEVMLGQGLKGQNRRSRWVMRIVAASVGGLLAAGVVGMCARVP